MENMRETKKKFKNLLFLCLVDMEKVKENWDTENIGKGEKIYRDFSPDSLLFTIPHQTVDKPPLPSNSYDA